MKTTMTKFALPLLISVYSLPAQEFGSFHPFEMGGGIQFTMPKDDYHNSFGYKIGGVWNFSPRYGVNLTYGSTEIDSSKGNKTKTVSAFANSSGGEIYLGIMEREEKGKKQENGEAFET